MPSQIPELYVWVRHASRCYHLARSREDIETANHVITVYACTPEQARKRYYQRQRYYNVTNRLRTYRPRSKKTVET